MGFLMPDDVLALYLFSLAFVGLIGSIICHKIDNWEPKFKQPWIFNILDDVDLEYVKKNIFR